MKKILSLIFLLSLSFSSLVWAQPAAKASYPQLATIPEETRELVRRLLEANGTRASMNKIFEKIIADAAPEDQAELRSLLRSDALIDQVIPVYAKHFTPEELKELLTFYKSPTGAKNLNLTPLLMTEVMNVSLVYLDTNAKKLKNSKNTPVSPKTSDK